MMSFREYLVSQNALHERLMRTGAIATYAAQSRKYGDEATRAFKGAQQALSKSTGKDDAERITAALDALLDGLIKQRQQIGAGVAVDVAGHVMAAKARKQR